MKKLIIVTIIIVIIGLGYFISKPIMYEYSELQRLRHERDSIENRINFLEIERIKKDSIVTILIVNNEFKIDSVNKAYSSKYKDLKNEYEKKIGDINNFSIDDNIRLFSELISEKDSFR